MAADEKMTERVMRIAARPEFIRNICTSAHIHHGKCVAPKTRLLLTHGEVITAEHLYEKASQQGIKVQENEEEIVYDVSQCDLEVFSLNKNAGKIEKKKISHAWKLKGGNVIKATLRNGASVTTTPEHRYLVLEDMQFIEKEAQELRLGDRVICARKIEIDEKDTLKEEILSKLVSQPCYVKLKNLFGMRIKDRILEKGLPQIYEKISPNINKKSFYHGIWKHRYALQDLLKLCNDFNIKKENIYDQIEYVSFRKSTKSTKSMHLPQNFEEFFYLAGLFFGDGSGMKFVVGKEELKDKCVKICNDLGIKEIFMLPRERTPYLITNTTLMYMLHALFDYPLKQKSHNIKVNDLLFRAPSYCIAQFLRAYFDCDGTVEKARGAVSITSASPQMLKDVQLLLLRFSCPSILQKDTLYISGIAAREFEKNIGFGMQEKRIKSERLTEKVQGSQVIDTIPLSNEKLIKVRKIPQASIDHHYYKYEKGILTPTVDTVLKLQQRFKDLQLETHWFGKLTTGDLAFVEVISLEQDYESIVYDFSVPDHKNFIAEGMVIHNTAFTDNLMAAAGQMASKYAGNLDQGMTTWQHKDEQERLMTVDAANVSMVHEYKDNEYLINLIDTPGHIDFGGNVTRAMRAIDGTIVLVCASEGIMPQTETVLKQALRERVKPILFINKVDRLIKEMKLPPEKIQERFLKTINAFNKLIERIAEPEYKEKWKVDIMAGSVAFGSARDNWALSFPFMQKKGVKFNDIMKIYEMDEETRKKWVWENAALFEVILDMVITHHPTPLEAQKYRIPKIWRGELESELGQSLLNCDRNGKLAFVITRVVIDPRSGKELSAGRLFSGTIQQGQEVYLNLNKQRQRIQQVYIYNGIKPDSLESLPAGNVLAISGVIGNAGETITLEPEQPFEELRHIFEPVITKAVKPAKIQDLPKVVEVLQKVGKEDPSIKIEINDETKEILMSGMGELHLEIVENRIKTEKGVEIITSAPIVVYRESITKKSIEVEGKSPNKHNKYYFVVEPVPEQLKQAMKDDMIPEGRVKKKNIELRKALMTAGMDSDDAEKVKDIFEGNIFIDRTRGQVHMIEVIEMILDMFEDVMKHGPLAREPCINVIVTLTDMKLHEDAIHRGPAQTYPAIREGIRGAMMTGAPVIYEPLQVILIEAPSDFMGTLSKLAAAKRGQLLDIITEEEGETTLKVKMPVNEMIGWASDLRSATNGRGTSSLMDQAFEKLPSELQPKIRDQIVKRKGLTEAQLGA